MSFFLSISKIVSIFVFGFWVLNIGSHAQVVPLEEVATLRTIFTRLHAKNWIISQYICTESKWNVTSNDTRIESSIACDCSDDNNTTCHVTNIQLKGQNLSGGIPDEFGDLTRLQVLNLSRNYLNGSIPASLARAPLTNLSLLGNRLTGPIPEEIGELTSLEDLDLEDNQFEGPLDSLGNLHNIKRLLLSANNFTGPIPDTFGNLKNLTDFRIDGTAISGKIPDFIGNWTNLVRLDMQGTLMEGPIPSTISSLKNLTQLRISDLNVSSMIFPDLRDMKNMEVLMLRNCSIKDSLPSYIGDMALLKALDLSFNRLTNEIPETLQNLGSLLFMSLGYNSLSGVVPDWILNGVIKSDLSYNNFTEPPDEYSCHLPVVNLVSSYPSSSGSSTVWCLMKDLRCPGKPIYHSLFINCGGPQMDEYEEDLTPMDAVTFHPEEGKWAVSSTGIYMGNDKASYIAKNTSGLNITGPEFYRTARLSPQSLKYYGLCLREGSYRVQLHFAEIMYSDDQTFSSVGRRIFDVSLQGNLVLKDFNIVEAAGGVGKNITKEFNDIYVNGSTLEIHLYWSGKGTTAIPSRGVYGPLISAITVTPNFNVNTVGLSAGAIVGIVAASCAIIILFLLVLRIKGFLGQKNLENYELRGLDLQTGYFTLRQIKAATNNFDPANKIGEGGFGPVYKGVLSDGAVIAVKQLSSRSKQGNREFVNEIGMISALQHPNLVKLYGCCIEGNQLLLVYEYLENNSLARALFGRDEERLNLDWPTRKEICLGIARGLAYLHEESRLKIVHRDIKATNVLLDKLLNAKISDFGLARLDEEENSHISTRIAGTIGYMAPEYAMRGYLTDKADVYSFGVVALEIVSGKSNTNYRPKEKFVYLLDWAYVLQEQGNLLELVDPSLGSNYSTEEAMKMLNLSLLCTNLSPTLRPSMSSVVSMIEGKMPVQAPLIKCSGMNQDARFKAFEVLSQDSQTHVSTFSDDSQVRRSMLMDGPRIDSSDSLPSKDKDLYDVNYLI